MDTRQFGQSIKQKYPQYQNIDDETLGSRMLEKYPQYRDRITTVSAQGQNAQQPDLLSKIAGVGKGAAEFLAPRVTSMIQNLPEVARKASPFEYAKNHPVSSVGEAVSQLPQAMVEGFGKGVLDPAAGVAGEIAPWLIPGGTFGKGVKGAAKFGGTIGALRGATTPGANIVERGIQTGLQGGIGAGVGGTVGAVSSGLQKLNTKRLGTRLLESQYNVPRSAGTKLKLEDTVGKLSDYGINNIDDIAGASEKVTGDTGVVTKLTREAVARAKPVDTSGLVGNPGSLVEQLAADPSIPQGQDQKFVDFIKKGVQKMLGSKGGVPATAANPLDAFDFIQQLESKAASMYRGKPGYMIPDQDRAMAQAYKMVADELKDRLFMDSGADQIAVNLAQDPLVLQKLAQVSPKLAQEASKIQSIAQLRSLAAPFVRGDQLAELTAAAQSLATKDIGQIASGLGRLVPSVADPLAPLKPLLGSRAVSSAIGGALRKSGGAVENVGRFAENVTNPILQRIIGTQMGK